MKKKIIWISWEEHRRSSELCDFFKIPFLVIKKKNNSIIEYLTTLFKTVSVVVQNKPRLLIIQNPSLILNILVIFIRPFFRYKLVVDAHNEAIEPFINNNLFIKLISKKLIPLADITIVTNQYLAKVVENFNGLPFILPDKIPAIDNPNKEHLTSKFAMVLVSTFARDEPYKNVFKAVEEFKNIVELYVTGNHKKLDVKYLNTLTKNIHFTGFLSDSDYLSLLNSVDILIDLTDIDNCLVCGAYEGVALKKPLILSDNQATKEYFSKGVVYTDNSETDLVKAIKTSIEKKDELRKQISELNVELQKSWLKKANDLKKQLEVL